ncbi:hypothetical protein GIB67_018684 [Kingdonia uniflora]|uniref:Uncharacterized protein n=1 Tax=Kingdonia uniflora TaxID=39325 RepID=A0A7J7NZU4_9MAGN|nr:hypothetical protein GIB67_018684 [Kingdonia uniflora]
MGGGGLGVLLEDDNLSPDGHVSALRLPSQSLSGTLSPGIGNLSNLQSVLLQNNAIFGPIPANMGKLQKLQALDLSNNNRLNNKSLSGPFPESLANIEGLTLVDLSYNYLSGLMPKLSSRIFKFIGNPLICGPNSQNNCSAVSPEPLSFPLDALRGKLI